MATGEEPGVIGLYRRYLHLLAKLAQQQNPRDTVVWGCCCLIFLSLPLLLWLDVANVWLLLPAVLGLWLLLFLWVRAAFSSAAPVARSQPLRDKLRLIFYRLKRHSLALMTLALLLLSCYASAKLVSVLLRRLI
jgi:uncharacterized membrane protein